MAQEAHAVSLTTLILILVLSFAIRLAFLAAHWTNLERMWYDFERHGFAYRTAAVIDLVTFAVYFVCALYGIWHVQDVATTLLGKCAFVWVAWLGVLALERLSIHRFPRTNHPQLFGEAKVALLAHLLTTLIGAFVMTALSAVWFWFRG